jgi:hypothetical protein
MSTTNLGLPYTDGEASSSARKNATMVMTGTGAQIAAIPTSQQIPFFKCLDNSGGLNMDEVYFKSASGLQLINFRRKHLHNFDTDIAGGLMLNQFIYNPRIIVFGEKGFNTASDFMYTWTGNAVLTEFFNNSIGRAYSLFSSWNGVTGDYLNVTAILGGINIGFAQMLLGIIKMVLDFQTNQIVRIGFGMEEVQNTVDSTRKMGIEMCPSTGINWQGVTANGITRTVSATSMPVSTYPTYKNYRMFFNPSNATIKISNSDGVLKVITSTVPSGGQIDSIRTWRMGIQTTNSQVKNIYVGNVKFIGHNNSTDFFDGPE